ncbi:MAG: restriction endonuclease subunit S [Chloroflexi bacterium]|nr:restriction endonuclease subunit S [Chloroflexota bacterium]
MQKTHSVPFEDVFSIPLKNGLTRPKAVRGSGTKMINMGELFAYSRIKNVHTDRVPFSENEKSYLLEDGDLLFARQSLVLAGAGKCSIFMGDKEPVTYEGHIIRARLNKEIVDPFFYYYFFNSPVGRSAIEGIVEQVAAAGVRGSDLAKLKVPHFPLPEQRAIAGILGALDDKIELNRRMNRTLESMARAVFRQWFVENEDVDSWEVGQVKDLGEVITGKTPPTNDRENYDGKIPFITIPDMHGKTFVIETGKTLSEKGVQTQRNKTLPPFSICISCIATPGLVTMTTKPSQTNQQINSLIPNDEKSVFYSFFALRELGDEIRARGGGGSVLLNLNKGQFETMPILIPPVDLMHKFQEFAEPLLMRLLANEKESRTLASLRDALLPKLMRGEVRVSEL